MGLAEVENEEIQNKAEACLFHRSMFSITVILSGEQQEPESITVKKQHLEQRHILPFIR